MFHTCTRRRLNLRNISFQQQRLARCLTAWLACLLAFWLASLLAAGELAKSLWEIYGHRVPWCCLPLFPSFEFLSVPFWFCSFLFKLIFLESSCGPPHISLIINCFVTWLFHQLSFRNPCVWAYKTAPVVVSLSFPRKRFKKKEVTLK